LPYEGRGPGGEFGIIVKVKRAAQTTNTLDTPRSVSGQRNNLAGRQHAGAGCDAAPIDLYFYVNRSIAREESSILHNVRPHSGRVFRREICIVFFVAVAFFSADLSAQSQPLVPSRGSASQRIENSAIDDLVVTDTIPQSNEAMACKRIRQLSVAELLAETIRRIHAEESVSSLFME
jgi:hypothetical protein